MSRYRSILALGGSSDEFIMRVDTTIAGATPSNQFEIKTSGGPYNYDVDWGDGQTDTGVTSATGITHTYATGGEYDIKISGTFPRIYYNNNSEGDKITEIKNWGIIQWQSFDRAFYGCGNLDLTATDYPDLTNCTTLARIFNGCSSFENTNGSISGWDTSTITNMEGVFAGCVLFNQSVNNWDVSNVTNMAELWQSASAYNQDLNSWDVSNVTTLNETFENASSFNGDISSWDVSSVTNMSETFFGATPFNQDVSGWNVSSVTTMYQMFSGCSSFNQDLSNWNVSSVTNMSALFNGCSAFNQDISGWDTSSVTTMGSMFNGATVFNANIGSWDTGNVTSMGYMFRSANAFNQDISSWDVRKVTSFSRMFNPATSFNQNLGSWDLRIAGTVMSKVFGGSTSMSTANYTDTIVGWANYVNTNSGPYNVSMSGQTNQTFDNSRGGGSGFEDAESARTYLTGETANWTISSDTIIN